MQRFTREALAEKKAREEKRLTDTATKKLLICGGTGCHATGSIALKETLENELEAKVADQIGEDGVSYSVQLLVTSLEPGEKLVDHAEEEAIDLIFVGIIKKSKVGKFFFGSTAQYVILQASCPVVAVKV